ncbi:thiol-disulfide isomerase/thioredoxin [Pedobacter africanus]|uniref:Thiol-disulfide isomerase/thioredoxin n=1 Tax=Pedobacter africanus TaxID=151894 RepID=A0ACC6KUT2_9SPHI|nr:TlpA disulfide reductase family protein [Pedobacter africanus]MDR6782910.1 thiol-disulfide isomerase/thioredoxin [Pedobacter africanus]
MPIIASAQLRSFTIKGKLSLSNDGEKVHLYYTKLNESKHDSTLIHNGTFTLEGEVDAAGIAYLIVGPVNSSNDIDFYLAPGFTSIATTDSLKHAKIGGNEIAADYYRLMEPSRPLQGQKMKYMLKYHRIPKAEKEHPPAQELLNKITMLDAQIAQTTNEFMNHNPDSHITLDLLIKQSGGLIDHAVVYPRFQKLSDRIKNSNKGKMFGERIAKARRMVAGANVPHFEALTPEGNTLKLETVLNSGKYTILDFWASWCSPCRKENPYLVQAYNTYSRKELNILSVSLDSDTGKWKAAIEKDGLLWQQVSSLKGWADPVAVLYGITALPQNLLLDAKGVILAKNLHAEDLMKKLADLTK